MVLGDVGQEGFELLGHHGAPRTLEHLDVFYQNLNKKNISESVF